MSFRWLCPELEIITPVRDETLTRDEEFQKLAEHGVNVPASTRQYSINTGLWGGTIGGGETHDSWEEVPTHVYDLVLEGDRADAPEQVAIEFEKGIPTALDGTAYAGPELIAVLGKMCRRHRVGLDVHIGDTVLGIKGRIAFEAGAGIVLIKAHRELEKITTTSWQRFWKDQMGEFYGKLLHEGLAFEPGHEGYRGADRQFSGTCVG